MSPPFNICLTTSVSKAVPVITGTLFILQLLNNRVNIRTQRIYPLYGLLHLGIQPGNINHLARIFRLYI